MTGHHVDTSLGISNHGGLVDHPSLLLNGNHDDPFRIESDEGFSGYANLRSFVVVPRLSVVVAVGVMEIMVGLVTAIRTR